MNWLIEKKLKAVKYKTIDCIEQLKMSQYQKNLYQFVEKICLVQKYLKLTTNKF